MVNPTIFVGLLAGYTVCAVLTALVTARDPASVGVPVEPSAPTEGTRARTGFSMVHRNRVRSPRCADVPARQLTAPRR